MAGANRATLVVDNTAADMVDLRFTDVDQADIANVPCVAAFNVVDRTLPDTIGVRH